MRGATTAIQALLLALCVAGIIIPLSQHVQGLVATRASEEQVVQPTTLPPFSAFRQPAVNSSGTSNSNITKTIWMYWDQGLDHLRSTNHPKYRADYACVQATIRLHPDWNVRVLDRTSARKLAPLYANLTDLDQDGVLNTVKYSNLLRTELLYLYGGIWADTSVCPFASYSDFVPELIRGNTSGFYAIPIQSASVKGEELQRVAKNCHIKCSKDPSCNRTDLDETSRYSRSTSSFFLVAAQPGISFFKLWMQRYYQVCRYYIEKGSKRYPYFITQCSFTQARAANPDMENAWHAFLGAVSSAKERLGGREICRGRKGARLKEPGAEEFAKETCLAVKKQDGALADYVRSPEYLEYIEQLVNATLSKRG